MKIKQILTAFVLFAISVTAYAQEYMLLPIIDVYDGDTIKTDLVWRLPEPLRFVSIRIYGIDTPEMPAASYATTGKLGRAQCVKEAELAIKARDRVRQIAAGQSRMKVSNYDWGRNGGRIVGTVTIDGVDIAKILIEEGLAVEYFGSGPRKDWCQ